MPAQVVSFDAAAQIVTVQPLIKHVVIGVDGEETVESYPEIRGVPVLYPRAGGFVIAWPLAVEDPVLLLVSEWSIDNYLEKGREDHPIDVRRHGLSGAMALPVGPYQASSTISEIVDGLILGHDSGAVIRIADDGTVRIGATAGAVQAVALAADVKDRLDTIQSTFDAHIHTTTATVGTGPPGVISPPTSSIGALAEVGSSKVEVEE
jgi:hypothetical protein